ncbi:MAG: family 10 glycosylhydrolase, partial [Ignavibacteria bacterium]|nr:family 10 glycosylhydrolase [Ignavibacteria bacterium]
MIKNIFVFFFISYLTITAQPLNEVRGVKLTNVDSNVLFSDKNITEAMDYLASIGINSIYCVVWNGGYTLYPSKIMNDQFGKPIFPGFQGRNPYQKVVIEAHRNGMEVFSWFEYGFASHYSGGSTHILTKFPSWGLRDTSGSLCVKNGFYWMSAVNPEAQNFMTSIIMETIENEDVDGILVSDRIPAMPVEGGYDSVTVSIYKSEHNGNSPTKYYKDEYWKRWRANKLNNWLKRLRDSIKSKSNNLIFATSPSVYPWAYDEYLQDSKSWIDSNLCDLFIPQLYRYNISDYIYELDRALSYVPISKRNIFSSGMLIKYGSYVISPTLLFNSLEANRQRRTNGEVFFFYEGLRADQNKLGDTLRATYYNTRASLNYRNGNIWRPKGCLLYT